MTRRCDPEPGLGSHVHASVPRLRHGHRRETYFFPLLFFLGGTCAPDRLASERPIAMACLRLFTFLPERPLRRVPRFRSCIACLTLRLAL